MVYKEHKSLLGALPGEGGFRGTRGPIVRMHSDITLSSPWFDEFDESIVAAIAHHVVCSAHDSRIANARIRVENQTINLTETS